MSGFISKKEFILCLSIAILLIAVFFIYSLGHKASNVVAQVTYDGEVIEIIDLNKDEIYHISAVYSVTLEVKDGAIHFINSLCPNHDCEGFGYISKPLETAICLPAKVAVQIVER